MVKNPDDIVVAQDLTPILIWVGGLAKAMVKKGVLTKAELIEELDTYQQAVGHLPTMMDIDEMKKTISRW